MYCRLRVLMAEREPKVTQQQLSEALDMGISTINRLCTNKFTRVDVSTIEKLCEYFECELWDLFVLRDAA